MTPSKQGGNTSYGEGTSEIVCLCVCGIIFPHEEVDSCCSRRLPKCHIPYVFDDASVLLCMYAGTCSAAAPGGFQTPFFPLLWDRICITVRTGTYWSRRSCIRMGECKRRRTKEGIQKPIAGVGMVTDDGGGHVVVVCTYATDSYPSWYPRGGLQLLCIMIMAPFFGE